MTSRSEHFFYTVQTTVLTLCLLVLTPSIAHASNDHYFEGIYTGISFSKQNYFGGAFLNQVDVLEQESVNVIDLSLGWRTVFASHWVFGVEGAYGIADGDLSLKEPLLLIEYENNHQWSVGTNIGRVVGKSQSWLLFGYAYFTQRDFDLEISTDTSNFTQHDGQGIWRYGLGVEKEILDRMSIRASIGQVYVDFGSKETNQDVDDKLDLLVGLVYQF